MGIVAQVNSSAILEAATHLASEPRGPPAEPVGVYGNGLPDVELEGVGREAVNTRMRPPPGELPNDSPTPTPTTPKNQQRQWVRWRIASAFPFPGSHFRSVRYNRGYPIAWGPSMPEKFDPYHRWLGISPKDQPPNHYRLLGIDHFEANPDVIEGAADQRMAHLKRFNAGKHSALAEKLLNEVAAARICLLNPAKKAIYDQALRQQFGARAEPAERYSFLNQFQTAGPRSPAAGPGRREEDEGQEQDALDRHPGASLPGWRRSS